MAYGKLVEGNRVWTAVAGPAQSADINELQDQVLAFAQARWTSVLRLGVVSQSAGSVVAPRWDETNRRWDLDSTRELHLQITVREGQKITGVTVSLEHSGSNTTGGSLILYSQAMTPSGGSMPARVSEWSYSDPFNTGGAATVYAITAAAQTDYYLSFVGLGTQSCYVYAAAFLAQLGN